MSNRLRWSVIALAAAAYAAAAVPEWHSATSVRRSTGIVLAVLVLWVGEVAPLGVTAMLIPVAATFAGVLPWNDAIAAWGDPVVFLFLGAFLLARALDKHGVFDRVAASPRLAGRGAPGVIVAVLLLSGGISTLQNNTAVCAMLLPVVTQIARRTPNPAAVLLALSYGSTFGGMATPVGTAPNFIGYAAMSRLDPSLSFVTWLRVGVPAWLGATLIGWLALAVSGRVAAWLRRGGVPGGPVWFNDELAAGVGPNRDGPSTPNADAASGARDRIGAAGSNSAAKIAAAAFIATALVWLTCGLIVGFMPAENAAHRWVRIYLPESLPPIAAAAALFLVRAGPRRRSVLDRQDFQSLDWDTLFLIAGGMCLGRVLQVGGAADALAQAVASASLPPLALLFAVALATVVLSEITSNTATASLMVPIAAALAAPAGLSPVQAIWLVALSASLGFALPVSTPPNALVYGTRLVPLRYMACTGVVVDVLAAAWVACCVIWWA